MPAYNAGKGANLSGRASDTQVTLSGVPASIAIDTPTSGAVVTNTGSGSVDWALVTTANLSASPSSGTLASSASSAITLTGNLLSTQVLSVTNTSGGRSLGNPISIVVGNPVTPTLTLSGPSSATATVASSNFTVVAANLIAPITVVPTNVAGVATFSPASVTPAPGDLTKLFTATWAAAGTGKQIKAVYGSVESNTLSIDVAPAPTPPPAPVGTFTSVTLTPGATGTLPFSFGHAFRQGDLPSGGSLSGLQVNVLSTWPDTSCRFGIVSGTFGGTNGVPATINLANGTAASGSTLTTANLQGLIGTVVVGAGAFGSASFSGTDWLFPSRVHATGPVMSSWIYRKAIGSDAHLVAWLEVQLYSDGSIDVLPWVENGYLNVATPTNKSATYTFTLGGTTRFSAAIDLKHHTRTPLVSGTLLSHWLGADPLVVVKHEADYLMRTDMVPSYYATVSPSASIVTSQPSTYTPLQQGSYPLSMGAAGYHPSIGMLPEWDALYLTSTAASLWGAIQRNAYSAGRYGIHYRDEGTNRPARVLDYPNLTLYGTDAIGDVSTSTTGTYPPVPAGGYVGFFKSSHHPSMGYLAALVTGRWYHIETCQFVSTMTALKTGNAVGGRDGTKGLIKPERGEFSTRGAAWSIRSLVQAVVVSPDGDTIKTELARILNENIDHFHARYVAGTQNPFGFTEPYSDYTDFGTGTTTGGSTSTVVAIATSSNVYVGNAAYDNRYVGRGQVLQIGGQDRAVTAYNGTTGAFTVSPAFTVSTAGVSFEIGDKTWLNANWMQDFFNAAWGYMKVLQPNLDATRTTRLDGFYAWNVKSVIGRFGLAGTDEYLYRDAAVYTIAISPSDHTDWVGGTGPWYANWGEIWTATERHDTFLPDAVKQLGDRSLRNDDQSDQDFSEPNGYWANLQPALAYAVRNGAEGADLAYQRMTSSPSWATLKAAWNSNPVWSVKPRIPVWRLGMTALTWKQFGNTADTVDPSASASINPNYPSRAPWGLTATGISNFLQLGVWYAWGGGAYDAAYGRLFLHGGGHADYGGNEVYAQDIRTDTAVWQLLRNPTGAVGNTGTLDDGLEATNVYFDGRPRSQHTYGALQAVNRDMYVFGAPASFSAPERAGWAAVFKFSNSTQDWTQLLQGTTRYGGPFVTAISSHDTKRRRFYAVGNGGGYISYWNRDTGTAHTDTTMAPNMNPTDGWLIYIPEYDIQVALCGTVGWAGGFSVLDYGRTTTFDGVRPGATGTAPAYPAIPYNARLYPNGVWVPGYGGGVGAILCWHGGTNIWVLTPPASGAVTTSPWAWSQVAASGSNTVNPGSIASHASGNASENGVWGRWFYDPVLKGCGLTLRNDRQTYFFALEAL